MILKESIYFNIDLLFDQISVLNKNITDSINTAYDEFIIIEEEIEKIELSSLVVSLIVIGTVLAISVILTIII